MEDDVLPIILLDGGRVSVYLGEPRGWRRSSSRPWPQCLVSRWLTCRSLPLKKTKK
ncbi:hypothetical protein Hanom_Chr06g00567061 [Helianthus anomalus]